VWRWRSIRNLGFALVEPAGRPRGLFAFEAVAVEEVDRAVELEQHAAQLFELTDEFRIQREGVWGDAPGLVEEEAAGGQLIEDRLGLGNGERRMSGWSGDFTGVAGWCRGSVADLAGADADPFIGGEFFEAHGTAGADFVGADADFGAHAELATVGEAGGGIPIDGGGIDFGEELAGGDSVAGDDAVGVSGAVVIDVFDGLLDVVTTSGSGCRSLYSV
jgi:hypothetical protein